MSGSRAERSEVVHGTFVMSVIVLGSTACQGLVRTEHKWRNWFWKRYSNTWKVADYTIIRKYKWLFVNGYECSSSQFAVKNMIKEWDK
jgi:hypothetical protein